MIANNSIIPKFQFAWFARRFCSFAPLLFKIPISQAEVRLCAIRVSFFPNEPIRNLWKPRNHSVFRNLPASLRLKTNPFQQPGGGWQFLLSAFARPTFGNCGFLPEIHLNPG